MPHRSISITCAFLATAASAANLTFWYLATYPADPLDMAAMARLGPEAVPWLVASLVADLAFYLLLLPVAWVLSRGMERWAGSVYGLIGATGAVLLLWHWPAALQGADTDRFVTIGHLVYVNLWNGVGAAAGALWWLGMGWRTRRIYRLFAALTFFLGGLSLIDVVVTKVGPVGMVGWVVMPLLVTLMIWPVAAVLGPLRSLPSH